VTEYLSISKRGYLPLHRLCYLRSPVVHRRWRRWSLVILISGLWTTESSRLVGRGRGHRTSRPERRAMPRKRRGVEGGLVILSSWRCKLVSSSIMCAFHKIDGRWSTDSSSASSPTAPHPSESSSGIGPIRRTTRIKRSRNGQDHYNSWIPQEVSTPGNGSVNALKLSLLTEPKGQLSPPATESTLPVTPQSSASSTFSISPSPVPSMPSPHPPLYARRGAVSVGPNNSSLGFFHDTASDHQSPAPLAPTLTWPFSSEQAQFVQNYMGYGEPDSTLRNDIISPAGQIVPGQFANAGFAQPGAEISLANAIHQTNQQFDSIQHRSFNTQTSHSFDPPHDPFFNPNVQNYLAGQCFTPAMTHQHCDDGTFTPTSHAANPMTEPWGATTHNFPMLSDARYCFPSSTPSHPEQGLSIHDTGPLQGCDFHDALPVLQAPGFPQDFGLYAYGAYAPLDNHNTSEHSWGSREPSLANSAFGFTRPNE
jgi:hypothetical protein